MKRLAGKVAIVTGASRGAGRGIALALGEAGATVYVTGRSVRGQATTDNLPGTVEDTAEELTERGGVGIPAQCDHTDAAQIEQLFLRIDSEQGHLDILVNNAWGGYENYDETFGKPFWEQPLVRWDRMLTAGVSPTMMTSYFATPLILTGRRGLIINTGIRAGIDDWDFENPESAWSGRVPVFYDVSKVAVNRMTFGMAQNLRPYAIAVVTLSLGWMRTERVMRDSLPSADDLPKTDSIEFGGRAVVALASDPDVMTKTGRTLSVSALSEEYGFGDVGG